MAPTSAVFSTARLHFFFHSQRAGIDGQLRKRLVTFVDEASTSFDCAVYDLRQADVLAALQRCLARQVRLRIAFHGANQETAQALQAAGLMPFATPIHPIGSHLMHNKFAVRDGRAVWNGSANWTDGGLQLQDNHCMIARSASLAKLFTAELDRMLTPQTFFPPPTTPKPVTIDGVHITPWFTTSAAIEGIEDAIVQPLQGVQRVRLLAFLVSDPGILQALLAFRPAASDIQGVLDPWGMKDGLGKKPADPTNYWFLRDSRFKRAPSHPFDDTPGAEQDFMHNKVIILGDRLVISGSYNFSENAEANDENMLLIDSPAVAGAFSTYFEALFALPANRTPIARPDFTIH